MCAARFRIVALAAHRLCFARGDPGVADQRTVAAHREIPGRRQACHRGLRWRSRSRDGRRLGPGRSQRIPRRNRDGRELRPVRASVVRPRTPRDWPWRYRGRGCRSKAAKRYRVRAHREAPTLRSCADARPASSTPTTASDNVVLDTGSHALSLPVACCRFPQNRCRTFDVEPHLDAD